MMQTQPRCLPCFLEQTIRAAQVIGLDRETTGQLVAKAARLISELDFQASPPENSEALYRIISEESGRADPFAKIKEESNRAAMNRLPVAEKIVRESTGRFAAAVSLAISGNVIDYGAHGDFDLDRSIRRCLAEEPAIDHRERLAREIEKAGEILYLADNAGEIVFDRLLVETMAGKVTVAVKGAPIINDATMVDAEACGLDQLAPVIDNGSAIPGTVPDKCSEEFRKIFDRADLIISKGQGNFETLCGCGRNICHLLVVKCPLVAGHIEELSGHPVALAEQVVFFEAAE